LFRDNGSSSQPFPEMHQNTAETGHVECDSAKEGLIYSDLPAAQGCAAKINRDKRLILCKKRKSHFSFFAL